MHLKFIALDIIQFPVQFPCLLAVVWAEMFVDIGTEALCRAL